MERADQVLKQDAGGRVWTAPERREALLDEFEHSGLPATQFATHLGVKYQTFASWVQKRRKARHVGSEVSGELPAVPRLRGWVEATVESRREEAGAALLVHLRGGAHLEVSNGAQALLAAQLLRALGEGGVC